MADFSEQEVSKNNIINDDVLGRIGSYVMKDIIDTQERKAYLSERVAELLERSDAAKKLTARKDAQRFRSSRIRESSDLRALLSTTRASIDWPRVKGMIDTARSDEYQGAAAPGSRNRLFTPLLSGLYTASPRKVEIAVAAAVEKDSARLQNGQFWPTTVIGSGPSGAIFTAQRREEQPDEAILTIDDGKYLGGQFAMAQAPLFRLNSRNRPTIPGDRQVLPGDKGNLNSLSPGTLEISDLDMSVYPTQNILATASAINTYLNSSLVANETKVLGVLPNRDDDSEGRYRIFTQKNGEMVEITTDRLVVASGLGKENYQFADRDTNKLIEAERKSDKPRIFTYDDFLKHFGDGTKQFPLRELAGKTISVIGTGDSAKSVIEVALGLQVRVGDSVAQADQAKKIFWWGQENTTKEDLCEALRARYNLIALEAPRADNNSDFESRIEAIERKTEKIKEVDGVLRVSSRNDSDQETSDIVVIAKGYESEIKDILGGLTRPTTISGELINDNEVAQRQLAAALEVGSVIRLFGKGDKDSYIEVLPALNGSVTIHYFIDGQDLSITYTAGEKEKALLQALDSGRVSSIEAIIRKDITRKGEIRIADRELSNDERTQFILDEQDNGNKVTILTRTNIIELPDNIKDSLDSSFRYRYQSRRTDFLEEQVYSADRLNSTINDILLTIREGILLSLPKAEAYSARVQNNLRQIIEDGDADALKPFIVSGFGFSYEDRSLRDYNSQLVISVEDGVVTYIDQITISNDPRENAEISVSLDVYIEKVFKLFENSMGSANFRVAEGRDVERPSFIFKEGAPALTEGEVLYGEIRNQNDLKEYVAQQQARGATVILADDDETYEVGSRISDSNSDYNVYQQDAYGSDLFRQDSRYTSRISLNRFYATDDRYSTLAVLSLPPAREINDELNEKYKKKFRKSKDIDKLSKLIQPGFAISLEGEDARKNLYVLKRTDDRVTYVDTNLIIDNDPVQAESTTSVANFLQDIRATLKEDTSEDGPQYENYFGVRFPIPIKEQQAINAANSLDIQAVPQALSGSEISVRAPRFETSDVTGRMSNEQTTIAKTILGEEVFIIGPPARLELSTRESSRLRTLGIDENTVAIFRYAPRNRALADTLPKSRMKPSMTAEQMNPGVLIRSMSSSAATKVKVPVENVARVIGETSLPYDADLNEMSAFALTAALQSRVSSEAPSSIELQLQLVDNNMVGTVKHDGMSQPSSKKVLDILLSDPLFMASFSQLVKATPTFTSKAISFELTPNGVDPYSITIRNQKVAAVKKPATKK